MDSYSNLVSRILEIETLANAAKEITTVESDPKFSSLNLVTPDWETILINDENFKNCHFLNERIPISTDTYYEYEKSKDTLFNITMAAKCRFVKKDEGNRYKKNCIILNSSEPLTKIASVMTLDKGPHIPISDNHKFSFEDCAVLTCNLCRSSFKLLAKLGYINKSSHQPCIAVTKVFDGKNIYNRFYNQLEESFGNETFIAILHLKINVRYMYLDKNNGGQKVYRIGGSVTNMLALNETKLDFRRTIDLGDITAIKCIEETQKSADINTKQDEQDMELKSIMDEMDIIQNDSIRNDDLLLEESPRKKLRFTESTIQNDPIFGDDLFLEEPPRKKLRITESTFSIDE